MKANTPTIYLDFAATTPVDGRVFKEMEPFFSKNFGNPTSMHSAGFFAKNAVENARDLIAQGLSAKPTEIFFTSSATESNNLALKGVMEANREKGGHLIVSSVEHACVKNTAEYLQKNGYKVTFLPVNKLGQINLDELEKAITKETVLISIIFANNEIGTIAPIKEIGEIARENSVLFHTDAVQAFGKLPINVGAQNIDLLTASSHKIYGPKGAGLLFVKNGVKIMPQTLGGGQENGLRSSTVNVPAIVGFAKAFEVCDLDQKRYAKLKETLILGLQSEKRDFLVNGDPKNCVQNIVSISFKNKSAEELVMKLDSQGIAVSTGASCSSGKIKGSHVLKACNLPSNYINGTLRISFGRTTTQDDTQKFLEALSK